MKTVQFIKYDNRKIYSHDMSRYLNVADIKDFIDAGYHVIVYRHNTTQDVTKEIVGEIVKKCKGDLTKVYQYMLSRKAV